MPAKTRISRGVDCEIIEKISQHTHFLNFEGKYRRKSSNMTISISDGFEAVQMVLELVTGWCAKEDVGLHGVDCEILKGKIKKIIS